MDNQTLLLQKLTGQYITNSLQNLQVVSSKFVRLSNTHFSNIFANFDTLTAKLNALNPVQILRNGYANVTKGDKTITDAGNVNVGDEINVNLYKGKLNCKVISKENK